MRASRSEPQHRNLMERQDIAKQMSARLTFLMNLICKE